MPCRAWSTACEHGSGEIFVDEPVRASARSAASTGCSTSSRPTRRQSRGSRAGAANRRSLISSSPALRRAAPMFDHNETLDQARAAQYPRRAGRGYRPARLDRRTGAGRSQRVSARLLVRERRGAVRARLVRRLRSRARRRRRARLAVCRRRADAAPTRSSARSAPMPARCCRPSARRSISCSCCRAPRR